MQAGEMSPGRAGRVSLRVEFWHETGGSIRLTSKADFSLRIIIKNDPERPSRRPTLFKQLAKYLHGLGLRAPD